MRYMGIDLGIRKVAVALVHDEEHRHDVRYTELTKGQSRQYELHTLAMFVRFWFTRWNPDEVFIEDGIIGNNRKYSIALAQTAGAVLTPFGLYMRPEVQMVNNRVWKKELLLNGAATKESVSLWLETAYPGYSAACEGDQDRVDATCVAIYGRTVIHRAQRLAELR